MRDELHFKLINMPGETISIIIDEVYNKTVSKPINFRSGYDMRYISSYMRNYRYGTDLEKIIKTEKLYDDLSIIRSRETSR